MLSRLFAFVRSLAAAIFKRDLALRRAEGGVHIVLQERAAQPAKSQAKAGKSGKAGKAAPAGSRAEVTAKKEAQELALISSELAELLGEVSETRLALRHLVFVEQALAKKGLRALHKLPLDVLQKALAQLEGLVINWSPVGLASLRSKMAVAIIDREHMDPDAEADAYRTAAVMDHEAEANAVDVQERSDDEALAAAYAALGAAAPAGSVEFQAELGSQSARAVAQPLPRHGAAAAEINLRELQT